jgi:hypothetical protein
MARQLVAGSNVLDINMVPAPPLVADLFGNVVDAQTSVPLAGVTVTVVGAASTTTDAAGNYAILNLVPGVYTITFEKAGYLTLTF